MNQDTDRIEGPIEDPVEGMDRLDRSRTPPRDLWPGIESRLHARRSRYGVWQFALAASLVAGLAGMFTLTLRDADVGSGATRGMPTFSAGLTDDSSAIVQANLSLVRQAERQLRQALRQNPDSPTLRSLLASTETRQRALSAML